MSEVKTDRSTEDRAARTAPARRALQERFERAVPPEITDPDERRQRAAELRRQFYSELGERSARARALARESREIQGLPAVVDDPHVLSAVANLLAAAEKASRARRDAA